MKYSYLLTMLFAFSLSSLYAQLPEKAEDISPLLTGEKMPDLKLINTEDQEVSVLSLVAKKPTVLIVYRGGWCPYCNTHLAELGQKEEDILGLGYQIVAISPDATESLKKTGDKDEISYELLSDADGAFAKAVGIAFKAPERYGKMLSKYSDSKNEGFLPVPSVFVINQSGEIDFEYINPNYKKRLSGDMLLAVLSELAMQED
ncbi:MAG: peroxiredoxin-like family protein [Bacteroidota bacterium]